MTNQLVRINDFFYNLNDNIKGIIDRVEFLPTEIGKNVFVSGIRMFANSVIELHVKTIKGFDPNFMTLEQLTSMTPSSDAWINATTFSEDILKHVINDFIKQVDTLTEYHLLITKWYIQTTPTVMQPSFEVTLFNSKKNAYKEILRVKKNYDTFVTSYKTLDKYGRLTKMKTFQNLTKLNGDNIKINGGFNNNNSLPYKPTTQTQQEKEKIMTDLELITCNINSL